MERLDPSTLAVDSRLPPMALPPLTRTTLALYAGGSGDHNPLHVDRDFAIGEAGLPDVIGHGMLTMAYLGRYLTLLFPQPWLETLSVRFHAPSAPGDHMCCEGMVIEIREDPGGRSARVALVARRGPGEADILISGEALVRLP